MRTPDKFISVHQLAVIRGLSRPGRWLWLKFRIGSRTAWRLWSHADHILAMIAVARLCWNWSYTLTLLVWAPLSACNAAFLIASTLKVLDGGYVP